MCFFQNYFGNSNHINSLWQIGNNVNCNQLVCFHLYIFFHSDLGILTSNVFQMFFFQKYFGNLISQIHRGKLGTTGLITCFAKSPPIYILVRSPFFRISKIFLTKPSLEIDNWCHFSHTRPSRPDLAISYAFCMSIPERAKFLKEIERKKMTM